MKRIIMKTTKFCSPQRVVITKSIQNDCFVNKTRVYNTGFYEIVDSYKKAGYKIIRCYSGTVREWGNMCDMSDLTSELSIYDRYGTSRRVDYKSVLWHVIHILTIAIKANSTNKYEKMLLRTIISDICRYAVINNANAYDPGYVKFALKHLKNVEETPAIIVLKRDLADLLDTSHFYNKKVCI